MRDITRMDIRRITPYGRYIDLDKPLIFDLTDEEIIALRKYHNKPNIAYEKVIVRKTNTQTQRTNVKRQYKMSRDQKYNRGRHHTKKKVKRGNGLKIIVGGILVCLIVGGKYLEAGGPGRNAQALEESYDSSYSEYTNSLNDLTEEAINSIDYSALIEQYDNSEESDELVDEEDNQVVEEIDERALLIQNICNIYQLDYGTVYQNLVNITNDFTNSEYLEGRVAGVTCKGEIVQASSEEELLIYTIRCMKQLPGQMGISSNGLYCRNGYTSGDNYLEQLNRVANVLGVDRCLLYAIVNAECSFNSDLFINSNNPAGIKKSDGSWWVFDTKEEGFFELGMELLKYYRKIGVSPDNIDEVTLGRIRDIHAPLSDGNQHWLPNVLDGLGYAKMHEAEMFGNYEQNNGLSF